MGILGIFGLGAKKKTRDQALEEQINLQLEKAGALSDQEFGGLFETLRFELSLTDTETLRSTGCRWSTRSIVALAATEQGDKAKNIERAEKIAEELILTNGSTGDGYIAVKRAVNELLDLQKIDASVAILNVAGRSPYFQPQFMYEARERIEQLRTQPTTVPAPALAPTR